jgi:phage/plasmid primase-like uncharacterized protein
MIAPTEQFRNSIARAGLTPPDAIIADGKLHRFPTNGKRGDDGGWYVYHDDGIPAGSFGCWRSDVRENWRADIGRKLSAAEELAHRERVASATQQREAEEKRLRAMAATKAKLLWDAADVVNGHPYLRRKRVRPTETLAEIHSGRAAAILGYAPQARGEPLTGNLIVAPIVADGKFMSAELIDETGRKSAIAGGAKHGGYWVADELPNDDGSSSMILIGEGIATVLSARDASGHPAIAALSAYNLEVVAKAMRERYPAATLVILADLGKDTGQPDSRAIEAAHATGALLAIPRFGEKREPGQKDFNDMLLACGAEAVNEAIANAKVLDGSEADPQPDDATEAVSDVPPWPEAMEAPAFHGIAGEFVRMVGPNTEADPAAILLQFLVAFGALVGRGPHFKVEGDEHHPNLFILLIGATAKGRKGTSWGRVREAFQRIEDWKPHVAGLSSGEGLKYHVRDERRETNTNKKGESVTGVVDTGVDDKRLLVVESEFASVLRVAQRQGSTLSATVREAWDTGNLRTLIKTDPIEATGAHICVVGHITADELRAELTATDAANGFANRFLFVAVKRSKFLPEGGDDADESELQVYADRLRDLACLARTRGRITRTPAARAAWSEVYPVLSSGSEGLHGAVTARAEAQVIRLSLIYALLDGAAQIDVPHLLAALAVWNYCDATAKHVFGQSLGNKAADEIMRRLHTAGDAGLTRTEIRDLFGRNLSADKIGVALELLRQKGQATVDSASSNGGRPTEVWRAKK